MDWALKTAGGCPELLNSVASLQRHFAQVFENEGHKQQAERLNRAADWLMNEVFCFKLITRHLYLLIK